MLTTVTEPDGIRQKFCILNFTQLRQQTWKVYVQPLMPLMSMTVNEQICKKLALAQQLFEN
jgi:hypothetical protein